MKLAPNILVIGGQRDWQQTILDILREEGHKPYPVYTHLEVEQLLPAQRFDVAVIDPILSADGRFGPKDLLMLQAVQRYNPTIQVIFVGPDLSDDSLETLRQLYPAAPTIARSRWDKNYFISLVKSFAGEGPNTDDKRLRSALQRSRFGTRPLRSQKLEYGPDRPRILCLESREDWQQILIDFFRQEQYYWDMAASAQQAIRLLENKGFHLVLISFNQPDLTQLASPAAFGIELLDFLIEFRPKTKILALTSRFTPSEVVKTLQKYPTVKLMEKHRFDTKLIQQIVTQAIQVPNLKIESLGLFKIWRNEQLIGHWPNPRAEALVKILLTRQLGDNQSVSAAELLELLWSSPEEWNYKNLLPLIRAAQQTLELDVDPRESSFILRGFSGYYFDVAGNIEWDVLKFRQFAQQGKYLVDAHQWSEALQVLEKAQGLYKGEYLAGDKEAAWALEFRRQLKREYTSLLTDLADVYAAQKRYEDGIRVCTQALVSDPLIESVYRRLIRFYYWKGQKAAALRTYRDCVKLFEDLFGESPKPVTRHLYEAIIKDEPIVNTLLDPDVVSQGEDHLYAGE